ncbi:uncharacterized protein LOC143238107 isoform X2 [Tachypleus tridentatus]|uniref:uncharacterized protein LOC143238107 isoform X2 n=1 Tax=Tachypleus tridentatus TaxID=6853 RepID=UPI003FD56F8E
MFENSCTELKSELSKMLNRLTSLELEWQKSITELTGDLDKQMKKMDLDSVKNYVEKEIRGILRKLIELEESRNLSDAAATTKTDYLNTMKMTIIQKELTQLQKDNASVVSFSQPTEISGFSLSEFETSSQGVNHISTHTVLNEHLHFAVSVPQKSGRTVFCNNCFHNGRNCGGKHTLTTPFSRTKKSVFPSLFTTSPYIQQTVLRGYDGHLYRGSIQKSTYLKRSPNWDHLLNIESGRPTSTSSQNLVSRAQM